MLDVWQGSEYAFGRFIRFIKHVLEMLLKINFSAKKHFKMPLRLV